jgi:hypothetical protein
MTLILCELFLYALNLTLFPHCQIFLPLFPCSLATPSKLPCVTMAVSSTMAHPVHSLPPVGSSCGNPVHTPLRRTVKPSILFAPSKICFALYCFRPLCRLAIGQRAPHHYIPAESPPLQGNQGLLPVCHSLRCHTLI